MSKFTDLEFSEALAQLSTTATPAEAYAAGQARSRHGATIENCALRFFAAPELTAEWKRGATENIASYGATEAGTA